MKTDSELEIIGDYKVHPAASLFPSIEGEDFEDLVFSIKTLGVLQPIIVSNGVLIDGRNRLRAVTRLRKEGCTITLPTKELAKTIESVSEFIFDCNVHRRNLTPDQTVAITVDVWPMIADEKKAKREATQFKAGNNANPEGKNQRTVTVNPPSPSSTGKEQVNTKPCSPVPRDRKKSDEQSTVGQVAKVAKVSHHKARQMMAVKKAAESGALPSDTVDKVKSGARKLKDIAPKPKPRPKPERPADDPAPDKEKDDAFEDIKKSIDRYLDLDRTNKKRLREKIEAYLDHKGN
jgi:ParB-like nuclease domain